MPCTLRLPEIFPQLEEDLTLFEFPTEGNLHCYMVYAVDGYRPGDGIRYSQPVFQKIAEVPDTVTPESCKELATKHDEPPPEIRLVKPPGHLGASRRFSCIFFCVNHVGEVSHRLGKWSL